MEENQEQHAIPQQISSYQFRLVGDMTLQQFFQVAAGAIIALILYSSTLPTYIKWPLILVSFLTGVAFAFFPLEDRPLQKWVLLFFKSIYTPTLFVWREDPNIPDFFQKEEITLPEGAEQTPLQTQQQHQQVPSSTEPETPLPQPEKKPIDSNQNLQGEVVPTADTQKQAQTVPGSITPEIKAGDTQKKTVEIPKAQHVEVEKQEKDIQQQQPQQQETTSEPDISPVATQSTIQKAKQAQFNQDAGPPMPPSKPNVVVGQVLGPDGEIVENAILEIKDTEGRPVRALKSNKLGHFMIVTSLSNGEYEIITEKDGLDFDNIKFEAKGEVIPPIAIWANKTQGQSAKEQNNKTENEKEPTPAQDEGSEKTIYNQQQQ